MIKYLVQFFKFLLPIVRTAVVQTAADVLTDIAYPERKRRPYTRYNRMEEPTLRQATMNVGRSVREASEAKQRAAEAVRKEAMAGAHFHDVLMVAFDLSGPSAYLAQQWLMDNLPKPGKGGDTDEIDLDCWWIADDLRFDRSDCDSAVFVSKGKQAEARDLLRKHGLVD